MSLARCMAETPSHHFTLWQAKYKFDNEMEGKYSQAVQPTPNQPQPGEPLSEFKRTQSKEEMWHRLGLTLKAISSKGNKNNGRRPDSNKSN